MRPCNRPSCEGTIDATGFCTVCFRQPAKTAPPPKQPEPQQKPPDPPSSRTVVVNAGGDDTLSLPIFSFPDPSSRIIQNPDAPDRGHKCSNCGKQINHGYGGQPPLSEGFCPHCRHPFSFLPSLHTGDLVHRQYEILGCFARGGFGWVYLARDKRLGGNLVVLKGLIDAADSDIARAERDALIRMDHQNIVRIFNFVEHEDKRTGETREYIVMEYVDGLVLSEIQKAAHDGRTPLGEPLRIEHIIACGLQVLSAFEYLHGRGLLYCDMKPDNVILRPGTRGETSDSRIKLIDMGAVRRTGQKTGKIIHTHGFLPEGEITKLSEQSDIHTLAVTLERLFHATRDWVDLGSAKSPIAVGLASFDRLRKRAQHEDPQRRFGSAAEMAEQLRGVHREISALREQRERPTPSTLFAPTAVLLDAGLGVVPSLERWTHGDSTTGTGAPLVHGLPEPVMVASGLPTPHVDPADSAAGEVLAATAGEPEARRLLDKLAAAKPGTPELCFVRCRAQIELGDLAGAEKSLAQVPKSVRDWRIAWHQALLKLATGKTEAAQAYFETVYDLVPGESAPKLALGYCAEYLEDHETAERLYTAVWRRDHSQGSAAFGLARINLARLNRKGAVDILDEVPKVSRHYDAAAAAAVIVLSGQLSRPGGGTEPPSPGSLTAAAARLPTLYVDDEARVRLTAIIYEAAFVLAQQEQPTSLGEEQELRRHLARSYRAMAGQARTAEDHNVLIDLKNEIRPWSLR
ncbi:tetratricopeptide repeat protein [Actinocrispum sp. NPDC049592]|uniref:tetratricopeptide repeat protein n=1 Tax=Actinocrispum sp. NPDC049592 TaxID=3154835 RepID=UPI00343758D5